MLDLNIFVLTRFFRRYCHLLLLIILFYGHLCWAVVTRCALRRKLMIKSFILGYEYCFFYCPVPRFLVRPIPVRQFPVSKCPPIRSRPSVTSPAISSPANSAIPPVSGVCILPCCPVQCLLHLWTK